MNPLGRLSWDIEGIYLLLNDGTYQRFVVPIPIPLRLFVLIQRLKP